MLICRRWVSPRLFRVFAVFIVVLGSLFFGVNAAQAASFDTVQGTNIYCRYVLNGASARLMTPTSSPTVCQTPTGGGYSIRNVSGGALSFFVKFTSSANVVTCGGSIMNFPNNADIGISSDPPSGASPAKLELIQTNVDRDGTQQLANGCAGSSADPLFTWGRGTAPVIVYPQDPAPTGTDNDCTLTDEALVKLMRSAGFTGDAIQEAAALAVAISGGKVNYLTFVGPNPGSYNIGLFGINDDANPTFNRNNLYSSAGYNAIKAVALGLASFPQYATGAYVPFLGRMSRAVATTGNYGSGAQLALLKCSDFPASDKTRTDSADNADRSDCGWTINVFRVLKCAFIPQGSNDYGARASTLVSSGAIGSVTTVVQSGIAMYSGIEDCNNTSAGTHCDGLSFDVSPNQEVNVNSDALSDVTGSTQLMLIRKFLEIAMILGFIAYWFRRITTSLGNKEE